MLPRHVLFCVHARATPGAAPPALGPGHRFGTSTAPLKIKRRTRTTRDEAVISALRDVHEDIGRLLRRRRRRRSRGPELELRPQLRTRPQPRVAAAPTPPGGARAAERHLEFAARGARGRGLSSGVPSLTEKSYSSPQWCVQQTSAAIRPAAPSRGRAAAGSTGRRCRALSPAPGRPQRARLRCPVRLGPEHRRPVIDGVRL